MNYQLASARGLWLIACLCVGFLYATRTAAQTTQTSSVERWDAFELSLPGSTYGNPFTDVEVSAQFTHAGKSTTVEGFYDGDGVYRVRFMPQDEGDWTYVTQSNRSELAGIAGHLTVIKPALLNHGPVRVQKVFHFQYADGTPYSPIGTTCYYWTLQPPGLQSQTLATLKDAPFNKVRMFVLPARDLTGDKVYPFEGTANTHWDFSRFNPRFFQHYEQRVADLRALGIEADVILFNPYDQGHFGFDHMTREGDARYLRYIVARLSAYRNVWWSIANEFDLEKKKTDDDWDHDFEVVSAHDPYHHLLSIHHSMRLYNYAQPWVTHASLQNGSAVEDFGRAELYRDVYNKPVVLDEVKYEGNLPQRWGQLSGQEMVQRMWQGTIAGTYVGHGEVFSDPAGEIWTVTGGILHGQSPSRIAFLRKVVEDAPATGIDPIDKWQDVHTAGKAGEYYLIYFGHEEPKDWEFALPRAGLAAGMRFNAQILDTWEMTTTDVQQQFTIIQDEKYRYHAEGHPHITLPGKPYVAIRLKRIGAATIKAAQPLESNPNE